MLPFAFPRLALLGFLWQPLLQAFLLNDGAGDVPNDEAVAAATAPAKAPEGGGRDGAGKQDMVEQGRAKQYLNRASIAPGASVAAVNPRRLQEVQPQLQPAQQQLSVVGLLEAAPPNSAAAAHGKQTIGDKDVELKTWGMSLKELYTFVDGCLDKSDDGAEKPPDNENCTCEKKWNTSTWNMRDFVSSCVKPTTKGLKLGIAQKTKEKFGAVQKPINLVISYAWQGNAYDFFVDVFDSMAETDEAFICSLAIDQHEQFGNETNPCEAPFRQAIKSTEEQKGLFLIVPNDNLRNDGTGMYSMGWCIFEIYLAWHKSLRIDVVKTKRSLAYLFGAFPTSVDFGDPYNPSENPVNDIHSTLNFANAPNLQAGLRKVKNEIEKTELWNLEEFRKWGSSIMQPGDVVGAEPGVQFRGKPWMQLDLIIQGAANGFFAVTCDKKAFATSLCGISFDNSKLKLCRSPAADEAANAAPQ